MCRRALRAKIETNLATHQSPELAAFIGARACGFTPAMPLFVTAFIEAQAAS